MTMKNNNLNDVSYFSQGLNFNNPTHENFELLVSKAKTYFPYSESLWEDSFWVVGKQEKIDIKSRKKTLRLIFGLTSPRSGSRKGTILFSEDYDNLIKSFISIRYIERGVGIGPQLTLLIAFRYLYSALGNNVLKVSEITNMHFIKATKTLKEREAPSSCYRIGNSLELLSEMMNRFNLTSIKLSYNSPFSRTLEYDPLSERSIERGNKLQLSDDAIEAILQLNLIIDNNEEKLIIELVKILFFTGFRISELLSLEKNCLVLKNENDEEFVGIRYYPLKYGNRKVRIRWFGELSGQLVKKSISEILKLTEEARIVSKWLFKHPGKSFLRTVIDTKEVLKLSDFCKAVGLNHESAAYSYLNRLGINTPLSFEKFDKIFSLNEEQKWAFEDRSSGYKVRLDKALFLIFKDTYTLSNYPKKFLPELLTEGTLMLVLAGKQDPDHPRKSIFEKYNLVDKNGGKIIVTSHMFRRYLNTIYNEGGVPLTILTKVFGRSNPKDTLSYIYTTPKQRTEEARKLFKEGSIIGPKVDIANKLPLKKRDEFIDTVVESVHYLGHGFCSHDWSTLPCAKHLQCLDNCIDFHMKKDDPKTEQYLTDQKKWAEKSLVSALSEIEEGTYGASSQADHYRRVIDSADRLMSKLDKK